MTQRKSLARKLIVLFIVLVILIPSVILLFALVWILRSEVTAAWVL